MLFITKCQTWRMSMFLTHGVLKILTNQFQSTDEILNCKKQYILQCTKITHLFIEFFCKCKIIILVNGTFYHFELIQAIGFKWSEKIKQWLMTKTWNFTQITLFSYANIKHP